MKIYCKTCGLPLSPELQEYSGEVYSNIDAGHPYIQKGYYKVCDGTWGYILSEAGTCENEKNCIVINVADLVNAVDYVIGSRLNGCCGLDGLDGPNKICTNGHEVATEHSDCWQPWAIVFKKDAVYLK